MRSASFAGPFPQQPLPQPQATITLGSTGDTLGTGSGIGSGTLNPSSSSSIGAGPPSLPGMPSNFVFSQVPLLQVGAAYT